MEEKNNKQSFESQDMAKWLESFFLDPYTQYLDETVFRIDLYESDRYFIVEALLPGVKKENIDISILKSVLHIKVKEYDELSGLTSIKTRTVNFPFSIEHLPNEAKFQQNILEIFIYKK